MNTEYVVVVIIDHYYILIIDRKYGVMIVHLGSRSGVYSGSSFSSSGNSSVTSEIISGADS